MSKVNPDASIYSVPNILTIMRIVLATAMFMILPLEFFKTALVLFIVAALTDYADGWWARKFNLVTKVGRILDPFADKMLVCGSFIYLLSFPKLCEVTLPWTGSFNWGIAPWMVVVIVLREMLVTMLRALVEGSGGDFSAKWIGKWKTGIQCIAVPACLVYLICLNGEKGTVPGWIVAVMILSIWVSVLLTVWSGLKYIKAAIRFSKTQPIH